MKLTNVLELINVVVDLKDNAETQRQRANGLAERNHNLTKMIDKTLGVDDADKISLHTHYGAGIEGRVNLLLSMVAMGAKSINKTILPKEKRSAK